MHRRALLAGFAALPVLALPARATTRTATSATFAAALREMPGGGELLLEGGDYGKVRIRGEWPDASPLVIRSADPDARARFSGLSVVESSNLILDGLDFVHRYTPGDPRFARPFQIQRSRSVTIRASLFEGDVAGPDSQHDTPGFATGYGLSVRGSRSVAVLGNELRGFGRGLVSNDVAGFVVQGNDVHGMRSDGMNFAAVRDLRIEGNHIHDFARELGGRDHADMIQFWTNRTSTPTRNVRIRGNLLNAGRQGYTQSIFIRNEEVDTGRAGPEMFYQDMEISDNVILNAHLHGITVGETVRLTITNNTVVHNAAALGQRDDSALWVPQIRVAEESRDVIIARNVTRKIVGHEGQPDWQVDRNLFVQDRTRLEPGHYGTVFRRDVMVDPSRPASFAALPGGPLDGSGIGATWLDGDTVGPPDQF